MSGRSFFISDASKKTGKIPIGISPGLLLDVLNVFRIKYTTFLKNNNLSINKTLSLMSHLCDGGLNKGTCF